MASRRAIIDIGSNTVRLVTYNGPARAPAVLHNEKVTAKLGRGVAETGLLSGKAMAAALAGLARYRLLIESAGISNVSVVATAAVRDAANGARFLDQIRALGLEPRLLSGEEEAITSAHGVMAAFPGAAGMVADLGGGSLELVDIEGDHCAHGVSLPLGSLHLPRLRKSGPAAFNRKVTKLLQEAELSVGHGLPLYLVGGSCRAFASYAMHATGWPLDDPHGFELDVELAIGLAGTLGRRRSKEPLQVPGISASRLGSLADVGALLAVLSQQVRPSRLVFSSWGLREGLIYRSLDPADRKRDPALDGIAEFTEHMGSSPSLASQVADWTAPVLGSEPGVRGNLRLSATMLALASLQVEPNLRVETAVDWALRKRWIGLDVEQRAMVAATVIAHGGRSSPVDLTRLAPEESLYQAAIWGQAIRLCRRLTGGSAQALSASNLAIEGDCLVLSVRQPFTALFTDTIDKDFRALARMLGLKAAFLATPSAAEPGASGAASGPIAA